VIVISKDIKLYFSTNKNNNKEKNIMPRPLRIEFDGAWYHVMNRGLSHIPIFNYSSHFEMFLQLIEDAFQLFKAKCHAYCLMNNHYHLLICTPKGNLSQVMQHIDGIYTKRFNRDTHRDGPLFRGRYKAILIDKDNYLVQVSRYIHLNPVSAKIVKKPENYQWSSYQYYVNPLRKPEWFFIEDVLAQMHSNQPLECYQKFVTTKQNHEIQKFYEESQQNVILGSNKFKKKVLTKLKSL
jgi:putative transposase